MQNLMAEEDIPEAFEGEFQQKKLGNQQKDVMSPIQLHMLVSLSKNDSHMHAEIGQSSDHMHRQNFTNARGEEKNMQGILSEKTSVGESLQNSMTDLARVKQPNQGRPEPYPVKDLSRQESDSTCKIASRSSRPSMTSPEHIPGSLMNSSITRYLQQLKEGDKENTASARNYDQVTVPTVIKTSFTSEEIYRQAYGSQRINLEKQHNAPTHPEPVMYNWRDKVLSPHSHERPSYPNVREMPQYSHEMSIYPIPGESSQHSQVVSIYPNHETSQYSPEMLSYQNPETSQYSHESSNYPNPEDAGHSSLPLISPVIYQANIFSFSPQPRFHLDPQFNNALTLNPNAPVSPTTHFAFPTGSQLIQNQQYMPPTNHLSLQPSQGLNQIYSVYPPSLPTRSSTAFPQSPVYFYPPPTYPDPPDSAVFTNGIPGHWPPPPAPQYIPQYSYAPSHQLQPHLSASSRRKDPTQPGSLNPQVLQDYLLPGQFNRTPHTPLVPPVLQPRIMSPVFPHRLEHRSKQGSHNESSKHWHVKESSKHRHVNGSPGHELQNGSPKHQLQNEGPKHQPENGSPKHQLQNGGPKHQPENVNPKHQFQNGSPKPSENESPAHQPEDVSPKYHSPEIVNGKKYMLEKYFTSMEVCNNSPFDSDDDEAVSFSNNLKDGPAETDGTRAGFTKFTGTSAQEIGGLHIAQKASCNGVSTFESDPVSQPTPWSSAPNGNAANDAVLQHSRPCVHIMTAPPVLVPSVTPGNNSDGNIQSSSPHQIKKSDLMTEVSEERKKKILAETAVVEIFDYNETQKSYPHASLTSSVVPVFNPVTSRDEAADDDDIEEIKVKTTDDEVSELAASRDFDRQMNISNPAQADTCNSNQSTKNQNVSLAKTSQSHPIKSTHTSPPQPSFSKSAAPFHQKNRVSASSSPARYQRHWARSSIAWSSYNPRELNTRSSSDNTQSMPRRGAGQARELNHVGHSQQGAKGDSGHPEPPAQRPSSAGSRRWQPASELRQRPSTATVFYGRKKLQVQPPATSHKDGLQHCLPASSHRDGLQVCQTIASHGDGLQTDRNNLSSQKEASLTQISRHKNSYQTTGSPQFDSSRVGEFSDKHSPRLCAELHRLPLKEVTEEHSGRLQAVATSTYQKLQEMTPRIAEGEISQWQCLPDEIWLYIFNFLSKSELIKLMLTSTYFSRLANDETLWKYITVKPKYSMTDLSLATIARHRPMSLAMVKCQGTNLTCESLHHFFSETQDRLKELNICGCNQGSLVGTVILQVAALYCTQLTHLDASFCHDLSEEAFIAMSDCAEKFESVCLNGFRSMGDSTLLVLLEKHGKSLRTLELFACFLLSASAFLSIGQHCTSLRRLCLGSCNKVTDSVIATLSMNLTHIEELDLRCSQNLRDNCINMIVHNCPRIHTLVLANCHQLSNKALTVIATKLKNTLRVLDVCGCNVTDDGVTYLAKNCAHLRTLDISSTKCTGVSLQRLADSSCHPCLEAVRFSFLSGLTEACLSSFICRCPSLKSVHVFGCSSLKKLDKLQSTHLGVSIEGD
ncbi:hypothetical protein BsWGS_07081 [Bradybaena similaris]